MKTTWEAMVEQSIRTADELGREFDFSEKEMEELREIVDSYPVCINPYYLRLVDKQDADDPIRKMCVPDIREFSEGGETDTSGEADNTVVKGMQHKYRQTALILSTNQCAMYCRHCFRKRLVGSSADEIARQLSEMADYVKQHKEINNVLISGGDAFMNSNELLRKYLEYFTAIDHLDFIRFGTRIPVVLPQRIYEDDGLLSLLEEFGRKKQIIIVTQFNHPRELTPEAVKALYSLRMAGCIVRNQTVLLKGVNDTPDILARLMNGLAANGVLPYYIFQCRPVTGVKNQFQVPVSKGYHIVEQAKRSMNGQSKSLRYVMSHPTGKIEIIGEKADGEFIFKYHQAKYERDASRIFFMELTKDQCWIGPDIPGAE